MPSCQLPACVAHYLRQVAFNCWRREVGSYKTRVELTDGHTVSILLSIETSRRHRIYCSISSDFRSWLNQHSAPSSLASWRWLLLFMEVVQLWQIYAMRTLLRLWLLMVRTASHKFVDCVIYVALYDDDDVDWAWRELLLQHNEPHRSAMITSMGCILLWPVVYKMFDQDNRLQE